MRGYNHVKNKARRRSVTLKEWIMNTTKRNTTNNPHRNKNNNTHNSNKKSINDSNKNSKVLDPLWQYPPSD